jgi:hypothetical protein
VRELNLVSSSLNVGKGKAQRARACPMRVYSQLLEDGYMRKQSVIGRGNEFRGKSKNSDSCYNDPDLSLASYSRTGKSRWPTMLPVACRS